MSTGRHVRRIAVAVAAALLLAACGGGGSGGGAGGGGSTPPPSGGNPAPQSLLAIVSDAQWDDTAVRQVLHVFAYGSHATDAQIAAWAAMSPRTAIDEMLVLTPTHPKLSPAEAADGVGDQGTSLAALARHFASDAPGNPVAPAFRSLFRLDNRVQGFAPDLTWSYAAVAFGINPVRMRLGFFETNDHLAVHQLLGNVNDAQLVRYFDDIVAGLARNDGYDQVLATAAVSAAIATQYGHHRNVVVDGVFSGNEDFAREFHQLFFGILGTADPRRHEDVTIKNTARALAGIRLSFQANGFVTDVPEYSRALHDPAELDILGARIAGADAREKMARLAAVAVEHPESQDNLPILIVRTLADDAPSAATTTALRGAWRAMTRKDLLRFLRDYAISPQFHDPARVKRWTSVERNLIAVNRLALRNAEVFADLYDVRAFTNESVEPFKPANNVFGGQRGVDAAASSAVFRTARNRAVERWVRYAIPVYAGPGGGEQTKDWRTAITADADGRYRVGAVARWLWQRFVADGLDHYGPQERAQLVALLAAGSDFASLATSGREPERGYSDVELRDNAELRTLLADLEAREMALASSDEQQRRIANALVGVGVDFISATPWFFVQQGRLP